MRMRAGIERELASRADPRVLRWFGHVEKFDECNVLIADVSGGRLRGGPRLGCGVEMALGSRGMMVEFARQ